MMIDIDFFHLWVSFLFFMLWPLFIFVYHFFLLSLGLKFKLSTALNYLVKSHETWLVGYIVEAKGLFNRY